jgi:hypothetical protein
MMTTFIWYIEEFCIKNSNHIRNTQSILHIMWRKRSLEHGGLDCFLVGEIFTLSFFFFLRNAIHKNANFTIFFEFSCISVRILQQFSLLLKREKSLSESYINLQPHF